ncbi:hypothetical protein AtDm6_1359 [Acetobacter tropicalis]|uniref:Uncharacterized protein n=1 Tax=Acetobacter tropicalis TaxID=104102 RepID=A0A095B4S1_9PROT|nr:hypothetical protein AtDm6_1359 [Acetobacter tropicalis]
MVTVYLTSAEALLLWKLPPAFNGGEQAASEAFGPIRAQSA